MRLTEGATRLVLVTRRLVFKVPRFTAGWYYLLAGLVSNLNEAAIWREGDEDVRLALCPMVWAMPGGWLNVMRRAYPVPASAIEPERFADLAYDLHPDNFGSYDGRVVLIDYA